MSSTAARASDVAQVVVTLSMRSTNFPAAVSWTWTLLVRSKIELLVKEQAVWSSVSILVAAWRSAGLRVPATWSWWIRNVSLMA